MNGASWTSWVQPLSDTLLQLLWQLGVLGGLAALLLHVLRHRTARLRYAVCAAALLLSLMLAALQFGTRWAEAEAQTLPAAPAVHPIWGGGAIKAEIPGVMAGEAEEPDAWSAQTPWRQGLAWAWLLGVALMSLRLLAGLVCVSRWRRRSQPAPARWQASLDRLAQRMGVGRSVALRVLPAAVDVAAGPFTVGWWRPVVLLPAGLLTGLPMPLLEALLAHELAHVRRWDYLAHLLQKAVEALLFFHPVIWWLSRRLRIERELVADALAAEQLGAPRQLAEALQALAVGPQAPALAAAAQGGELFQRVRALVQRSPREPASDQPRLLSALLLLSLLAGALLLPLAGVPSATAQASSASAVPAATGLHLSADLALASRQVLVMDADSGEVLLARDAQQAVPIASISKLMTALVVLDARQDLQQMLRVSREDVRASPFSSASLRPGQRLSREAALTLMLQSSDNRAAQLLARQYPGGLAAFELATQDKARRLGLHSAELRHPTGAPASSRASAADVARLIEAAAGEPLIQQSAGAAQARVLVDGKPLESSHSNPLVGAPGWSILLAKTGFTQAAGRCVALQMRQQGRRLSVVLLGAPDAAQRDADLQRIRDALQG